MNKPDVFQQARLAEQLTAQYNRATSGTRDILVFGAMMISLGKIINIQYAREDDGQLLDKSGGLKGWIGAHCPEINYKTAYGYYRLAQSLYETLELPKSTDLQRLLLAASEDLTGKEAKQRVLIEQALSGKSKRQLEFDFSIRRQSGKVGAPLANQNARKDRATPADYELQKMIIERDIGKAIAKLSRMVESKRAATIGIRGLRTLIEELTYLTEQAGAILKEMGEQKLKG